MPRSTVMPAGFVEGQAWNRLIDELTQTADRHDLPRGAAKVTDGRRPSGFVALVRELQALVPQEARRHDHSDVALTEGIVVARRTVKQWRAKKARKINPAPRGLGFLSFAEAVGQVVVAVAVVARPHPVGAAMLKTHNRLIVHFIGLLGAEADGPIAVAALVVIVALVVFISATPL